MAIKKILSFSCKLCFISFALTSFLNPIAKADTITSTSPTLPYATSYYNGYNMVWNDEFNENNLDLTKWKYGTTPENGSMKYVNSSDNVYVKDGNLVLAAIKDDSLGDKFTASSGMVITEGLASWKYGRFDIRAKLPVEQGMWPAIWMMPQDSKYGWPNDGEIDIVEALGSEKNKIYGTLHSGNNTDGGQSTGVTYTLSSGDLSDDYHTYSIIWEPEKIHFLIDNKEYGVVDKWPSYFKVNDTQYSLDFPDPFNKPFYLMLNLGVGGDWGGEPNNTTKWGENTKMYVDYVRVYQKSK